MTNFVKGQWYQNKNTKQYFQCMTDAARGDNYLRLRLAGSESCFVKYHMDITVYAPASLTPDFSKAKEGDECWLYGIGETGINSIGDDYVTVWDDENKYVFDKSGYLYFIGEYIGDAYTQGVSCELEESPLLFNSFAQFQAYWAEKALEMGCNHD